MTASTPTAEAGPVSPPQTAELIELFNAVNTSTSVEDLIARGKTVSDRMALLDRDGAIRVLNEALVERTNLEVEFRRPILSAADQVTEEVEDAWATKPWESAEADTPLDGARAFSKAINTPLRNDSDAIIESVNPESPPWQKLQAINQLIGAVTVKIGPPPAAE